MAGVDIVERYLPSEFVVRLPPADRAWRGRIILLLWALGYPLEMAWCLGMVEDETQTELYRSAMAELDDARLEDDLVASTAQRGDAHHLVFGWLGSIEVLVRQ